MLAGMRIYCRYDDQFRLYVLMVDQAVAVLDENEFLGFLTQLQHLLVYWTNMSPQEVRPNIQVPEDNYKHRPSSNKSAEWRMLASGYSAEQIAGYWPRLTMGVG